MIKINLKSKLFFCGLTLIILGMAISFIPKIQAISELKNENKKIEEFIRKSDISNDDATMTTKQPVLESKNNNSTNYSMVLEIPKINLKKGLYNIDSKYNNVEYNIQIISDSNMPDDSKGRLILAGHNGNSKISYFRNLARLEDNDRVYIYYNGIKYEYTVKEHYILEKTGKIEFKKSNISTLVLTTCVANQNKQLVYLAYLNNIINY